MREERIITAGFGGQGILTAGEFFALSAIEANMKASWLPSYGPEMRGGVAKCAVVMSDEEISCPIVEAPDVLIVMNLPSFTTYVPWVKENGLVIVNKSIVSVPDKAPRSDVEFVYVDANVIAQQLGNKRVANTVMLGAYCSRQGLLLDKDMIISGIKRALKGRKSQFIPLNIQALKAGMRAVNAKK